MPSSMDPSFIYGSDPRNPMGNGQQQPQPSARSFPSAQAPPRMMDNRNQMPPMQQQQQQGPPQHSFPPGAAPNGFSTAMNRGPPPRRFMGHSSQQQQQQQQMRATGAPVPRFSDAQLQQMRGEMPPMNAAEFQQMREMQMQQQRQHAEQLKMRSEMPPNMQGGGQMPPAAMQAEMRARASMSPMANRQMPPNNMMYAQAFSPSQQANLAGASIPLRENLLHNVRAGPPMTIEDMRLAQAKALAAQQQQQQGGRPQKSPTKAASLQDAASALLTMGSTLRKSEDGSADEKQDSVDGDDDSKASGAPDTKPFPTRLALPEDEEKLNSMHCFLRAELLEIFLVENVPRPPSKPANLVENSLEALEAELSHSPPPNSAKNRIGIRCVHCQRASKIYGQECEAPMSVFYPKSLAELYRLVTSWQRVHLRKCRNLPKGVRDAYTTLRATDKTRGKTHYWVTSAKKIGLKDSKRRGGGIVFDP